MNQLLFRNHEKPLADYLVNHPVLLELECVLCKIVNRSLDDLGRDLISTDKFLNPFHSFWSKILFTRLTAHTRGNMLNQIKFSVVLQCIGHLCFHHGFIHLLNIGKQAHSPRLGSTRLFGNLSSAQKRFYSSQFRCQPAAGFAEGY